MKLKIDLHVHTCFSRDGLTTPKELVAYAQKAGLDGVAITDHDRVDCAIKLARKLNFPIIIPGIEISSLNGHVLGINLQEEVPKNLEINETIDRIHELGGLAVACHPKAPIKSSLKGDLSPKFDAVEVVNASTFQFRRSAQRAKKMAASLGLAQVAGSDAHYAPEIGLAYTLVEAEPNVEEIVKAISKGLCQPFGRAIPLTMRLKRKILTFMKPHPTP